MSHSPASSSPIDPITGRRMLVRTQTAVTEKLPSWGVAIIESHHAPGFVMEWRSHPFIKVQYVLAGHGQIQIGAESYPVGPRDIVVVPAERRNRIEDDPNSPMSLYVLCIEKRLLGFDPYVTSVLPHGKQACQLHFSQRIERRLRRLLYQQWQADPTTPLAMVANALEVLSLLTSESIPSGESVSDLSLEPDIDEVAAYVRHVDSYFFEASTIDDVVKELGMPRRRFTHIFRRLTGQTWLNYVQRKRVDHACQLLEESDRTIASIAFECGFGELSTFYRAFRKIRGVTPKVWRKTHRE
ncbi:helix-turn-helix domain-containing protein [Blastopirellula marina]|nr:AraC family transcriptional regulator [Blastopirellula marina]